MYCLVMSKSILDETQEIWTLYQATDPRAFPPVPIYTSKQKSLRISGQLKAVKALVQEPIPQPRAPQAEMHPDSPTDECKDGHSITNGQKLETKHCPATAMTNMLYSYNQKHVEGE